MASSISSEFQPSFCQPMPDSMSSGSDTGGLLPVPEKKLSLKIGREKPRTELMLPDTVFKEHETIKSGYVEKRYRTRKSWKTRFLVLRSHHLSVYKNEKEYELLYSIDLFNTSTISETEKKKHSNVFSICTPDKLFYFKCQCYSERVEWLKALREARDSEPSIPFEKLAYASRPSNPGDTDVSWDGNPASSGSQSSQQSDNQEFSPHIGDLVSDSSDYEREGDGPAPRCNGDISLSPRTPITSPKRISQDLQLLNATPNLSTQVLMQGVLFKHCIGYKAWRSRWFVLRDSQLCYYKNDKEYELHGIIHRNDIKGVQLATSTSKSKTFCFKVITERRAYKLAAPTSEEQTAWIEAIRALL